MVQRQVISCSYLLFGSFLILLCVSIDRAFLSLLPALLNIVSRDQVALLDYGQVKELPDNLRLGYANLVLDMADKNASRVAQSFR